MAQADDFPTGPYPRIEPRPGYSTGVDRVNDVHEKLADAAAGVSGAGAVLGMTVGQLNEWLQAGAFIVSIVAGICAARYYWLKANRP